MMSPTYGWSRALSDDVFEEIRKEGRLTDAHKERIEKEYGARGKKAIEAYLSDKVVKYKDFFVVQGTKGRYVVEEGFCGCGDYLLRLAAKGGICYHALAVKIAQATGKYQTKDEWYYEQIVNKPR